MSVPSQREEAKIGGWCQAVFRSLSQGLLEPDLDLLPASPLLPLFLSNRSLVSGSSHVGTA